MNNPTAPIIFCIGVCLYETSIIYHSGYGVASVITYA